MLRSGRRAPGRPPRLSGRRRRRPGRSAAGTVQAAERRLDRRLSPEPISARIRAIEPKTARTARARPDATDTRDDILRIAERLFREVGYRKTTVAEVAAELGMSPANAYRFFESKRAINQAVAERVLGEIGDALEAIVERGDLPERLRQLLGALARISEERFMSNRRIHDMVEAAMAESWEVCHNYVLRVERPIAEVVAAGAVDGSLDVDDPAIAARCVQAAMLSYAHPAMMAQAEDRPGLAADDMIVFALRAVAPQIA